MRAARRSFQRRSARSVAAAAAISAWLVGSTLNPVAAISEGSSLAWIAEPATASVDDQFITSAVGDPSGPKVKVVIYNGSGEQARIAGIPIVLSIESGPQCLVADTARAFTNADGVAVFEPVISCEGIGFQLKASADDTASQQSGHIATVTSGLFDVRQGAVTGCDGSCTDTAGAGGTEVQITADVAGYLVLDLKSDELTCQGYTTSSMLADFDVRGAGEGWTTVTIRLDESQVTRSAKKYEVCLKKPDRRAIQLPDCSKKVTGSCVDSRKRLKGGHVRVTISVEPGDPRVGL